MLTKSHTTFAAFMVGAVLALAVASPNAFSMSVGQAPAFPSAVPSHPGQLTGKAAATEAARSQERYYSSYGDAEPLVSSQTPADDGGVAWTAIGIAIGAGCLLAGALVARTRRTHRARVVA